MTIEFKLKKEYNCIIVALDRTGILTLLPRSEKLGVVGIDAKEHPVPTQEEVHRIFETNKELIDIKAGQDFTQLLITPFAMPLAFLVHKASSALIKHTKDKKISKTKRNLEQKDIPLEVNLRNPC